MTAAAAVVVLSVTGSGLVKVLAVQRTNRALLRALVIDHPTDSGWILRNPLSVGDSAALAEATDRHLSAAGHLAWKGRSRTQGLLALATGDRREAAKTFALTDDAMSRFWGARVAAREMRFEDAARLLSRDYPATMTLLEEKAAAAGARGDLEEANVSLQIAARCPVDDLDASALITRGHLRQVVGAYDSALNDFNRALAVCPGCYQAYLYRGQTWLAQGLGTQDTVERDLRRAVTLAPEERDAALTWAQWLLSVHRWGEAEAAFQAWHERHPLDAESVWNLAFIYCHTGRPQEGQSVMRRFLDRSVAAKTENDRITQLVAQCPG